eukprot:scaffold4274_cov175-Amphora_coffeaeformis.AAC.10
MDNSLFRNLREPYTMTQKALSFSVPIRRGRDGSGASTRNSKSGSTRITTNKHNALPSQPDSDRQGETHGAAVTMRRARSEPRQKKSTAAALAALDSILSNKEAPAVLPAPLAPWDIQVVDASSSRVVSPTGVDGLTLSPTTAGKDDPPPEDAEGIEVSLPTTTAVISPMARVAATASTESQTPAAVVAAAATVLSPSEGYHDDTNTVTSSRREGRGMLGRLTGKTEKSLKPCQMHQQPSQNHQEEVSERRHMLSNPYRMFKASSTSSKDEDIVSSVMRAQEQKKKFLNMPSEAPGTKTTTVAPTKEPSPLMAAAASLGEGAAQKAHLLEAQAAQVATRTNVRGISPVQTNDNDEQPKQEAFVKSLSPVHVSSEEHEGNTGETRKEEAPVKSASPRCLQTSSPQENTLANHERRREETPTNSVSHLRPQTHSPQDEHKVTNNETRREAPMKAVSPLDLQTHSPSPPLPPPWQQQQNRAPTEINAGNEEKQKEETRVNSPSPPRQQTRVPREHKKPSTSSRPKKAIQEVSTPKRKGRAPSLLLDLTSDVSLRASSPFENRPKNDTPKKHRTRRDRRSERKNHSSSNNHKDRSRLARNVPKEKQLQQRPRSPWDMSRRIDSVPSKIELQRQEDDRVDRRERRRKHCYSDDDYSESTVSDSTSVRDLSCESSQSDNNSFCSNDEYTSASRYDDEYMHDDRRVEIGHNHSSRRSYYYDGPSSTWAYDDNSTIESGSFISGHPNSTMKKIEFYRSKSLGHRLPRDRKSRHKTARGHYDNISKSSHTMSRNQSQRHYRQRANKIYQESSWDDSDIVSQESHLLSRTESEVSEALDISRKVGTDADSVSAASLAFEQIPRIHTQSTAGDESAFNEIKPDKTERFRLVDTPIHLDFLSDGEGDTDIELDRALSKSIHSGWLCGWFG